MTSLFVSPFFYTPILGRVRELLINSEKGSTSPIFDRRRESFKLTVFNNSCSDPKIPKEEISEEKLRTSIDGYLAKSRKETEHTAEIISENKQDNGI
jgi:hypothetical protein